MARIELSTIEKIEKERNSIHDKVTATYTIFEASGEKYVQLDTYGKVGRAIPGKISQSIQFDKDTAAFFVDLLQSEFGL